MAKEIIVPNSLDLDNANFALTGAPTKYEALDDPASTPNDADYIACSTDGQEIRFGFTNTSGNITASTVINYVDLVHRTLNPGTYSGQEHIAGVRMAGANSYGAWRPFQAAATNDRDTLAQNPNAGSPTPWNKTSLDAIVGILGFRDLVAPVDGGRYMQFYIEIDYVADPAKVGAARDVLSRDLWLRRSLLPTIRGRLPLRAIDRELLGVGLWTHYGIPRPTDEGAGMKVWQREPGINLSQEIDLDSPDLGVLVEDLPARRFWTVDWDPMISEEPPGSLRNGIPGITPGAGRVHTRTGDAWGENPAAAAQGLLGLVKVPADVEIITPEGTAVQGAATTLISNPAFASGVSTNWTPTAVAVDTTDVITESGDSPQSAKFTRVGVGSCRLVSAAISLAASTAYMLSLYHKDDSAVKLQIQVVRLSDGFYWQTGSTWTAGTQTHDITVRAAPGDRDALGPIIKDGATGNVEIRIIAESGSGQINHVYHVQLEANRWVSTPILASAGTRNATTTKLENNNGKRVWPHVQGTTKIWARPNWNTADLASGNLRLLVAYFDANNFEQLFYSVSAGRFQFQRSVGGVTSTAFYTIALTRWTRYKIRLRRTGAQAEHGLAANTLSIFVNGVKGTDAVSSAFGALPADPLYLWIGHDETAVNHWEGFVEQRESTPVVLSDEEIAGEDA